MRKSFIMFAAAMILAACTRPLSVDCGGELTLSEGWTLESESGVTCQAAVPSTVAGALYDAGILPVNLFESDNYSKVDVSLFDQKWTYTKSFDIDVRDVNYILEFDGIGYRADISFNGVRIASADTTFGVYIARKYDVYKLVKRHNKLSVCVSQAKVGDLNIGFVDWNPRPFGESMGLVRPVRLCVSGPVSVEDVYVKPELDIETLSEAELEVLVTLKNHSDKEVSGVINLTRQDAEPCAIPVTIPSGECVEYPLTSSQAACLHVENPRVWWTCDMGTPELYTMKAEFVADGTISDSKEVTFGIRKIESRLISDNYRQFTLNGKDILVKGAGWTDDIFLRDSHQSVEQQVKYVIDMNMNCIRFENIWGKDDYVYDLCDKYGLLAMVGWSCQWEWEDYCGVPEKGRYGCIYTPELMDLAVKYFHDQVIRLHNHVSLMAWLTGSDGMAVPELDARYMDIYNRYEYRPYVCSAKKLLSPTQGWSGTKMDGPYEYVGPEYWYLDTKEGGAFGFNTETCAGASFPQKESLLKMIPQDSLWPLNGVWNFHCTSSSSAMNSTAVMEEVASGNYGEFKDLDDFLMKAYAVDYNATRAMFEAFRANLPNTTGIIQWMLNSAWPSLYWQLYDWYGVPTAGYYGVKKACEPVQLIFNYKDRKVYALNESGSDADVKASVKIFDEESVPVKSSEYTISVENRQPEAVCDLSGFDGKAHFVALSLTLEDGRTVDNFYSIASEDNKYKWGESTWYVLPIEQYADLRFAFQGEPDKVEMTVSDIDGGKKVTLANNSSRICYMNILKLKDARGNLVVPAYWNDNFFPLLPGETKSVVCIFETEGETAVEIVSK